MTAAAEKQLLTNDWIRVSDSAIHGRGVYARRDIPDGTLVIEYVGERITKAESRRRELERRKRVQRGEEGIVTIFDLNERFDLDGRGDDNVARFINHSCRPNCQAEQRRGRIWIVARRDIPAGAELTFDYGFPYREWRLHPCRCGERGCAGYIVNAAQRWRVRRLVRVERASRRA